MPALKVIISGGGTGGHVFPAIAIADAIKSLRPEAEILFVGAIGRLEMEKVPEAGYQIEGLNISGLQRRLTFKNLSFPFKVLGSLIKARKIVKKFNPDVAVGVGGYASGPLLRTAASKGIPTVIQEQNSYPGITNKLLAKKAKKICVAYEGMEKFFPPSKIFLSGNPVRKKVFQIEGKREQAISHFGLDPNKKTVLIIGGSLGAKTINESINAAIPEIAKHGSIQIIWQSGKSYAETATQSIKNNGFTAVFIKEMDLAYAAADITISRAGAMSISELCLIAKPCILVPSPHVAEDHQTRNAEALVVKKAAIMVKDSEARNSLWNQAYALLNNDELKNELAANIKKLGIADADIRIAKEVIQIAEQK